MHTNKHAYYKKARRKTTSISSPFLWDLIHPENVSKYQQPLSIRAGPGQETFMIVLHGSHTHSHKERGPLSFLLTYDCLTIQRFISNVYRSSGVQQCSTEPLIYCKRTWWKWKSLLVLRQQVKEYSPVPGLSCVSMKARVNMSELRRDIRGRLREGKRGEMLMCSRRAGAHFQIRHDIGSWHETEVCGCRNICWMKKRLWSFRNLDALRSLLKTALLQFNIHFHFDHESAAFLEANSQTPPFLFLLSCSCCVLHYKIHRWQNMFHIWELKQFASLKKTSQFVLFFHFTCSAFMEKNPHKVSLKL